MNKILTVPFVLICLTLSACTGRTGNTAELDSLTFEVPEEPTLVADVDSIVIDSTDTAIHRYEGTDSLTYAREH